MAEFNGHDVMVVKVKGDFMWNHHDDTDDLLLVLKGQVTMRMGDGKVEQRRSSGQVLRCRNAYRDLWRHGE